MNDGLGKRQSSESVELVGRSQSNGRSLLSEK